MVTSIYRKRLAVALVWLFVLILTVFATACNERRQESGSATPPPSGQDSQQAPPVQSAESAVQQPEPAAESGTEGKTARAEDGGDATNEDAAQQAQQIPPRGNDDEDSTVERPKPRPVRPGDIVSVEARLRRAEFNNAVDATLSHLTFEFRSNLARMEGETVEVQLSDIRDKVKGELDLGLCRIEIYPVVSTPREVGRTALGGGRFLIEGAFQLWVYQPEDELIGVFAINSDGHFMSAPPAEAAVGYGVRARRNINDYGPVPHIIYRKGNEGGHTEYLLTVQCEEGTFDSEKVKDDNHNEYEYRFPNSLLEFYTPEQAKRGK